MAFMLMKCGGENCDRPLYVEAVIGEQVVYCYRRGCANVIEFKGGEVDEE